MRNILTILGCALVTALPKILPLEFFSKAKISDELSRFLNIIPYTSLTILIVRGILTASSKMFWPTVIASIVAAVIAFKKESIGWTIAGGVFAAYMILEML